MAFMTVYYFHDILGTSIGVTIDVLVTYHSWLVITLPCHGMYDIVAQQWGGICPCVSQ